PPPSGADHDRFVAAVRAYQSRGALCPFNAPDGRCAIYEVRPIACRATNVVDTSEYCAPGRGRGPTVVRHPELQAAIAAAKQTFRNHAERALPNAVAAALAEAPQR